MHVEAFRCVRLLFATVSGDLHLSLDMDFQLHLRSSCSKAKQQLSHLPSPCFTPYMDERNEVAKIARSQTTARVRPGIRIQAARISTYPY